MPNSKYAGRYKEYNREWMRAHREEEADHERLLQENARLIEKHEAYLSKLAKVQALRRKLGMDKAA